LESHSWSALRCMNRQVVFVSIFCVVCEVGVRSTKGSVLPPTDDPRCPVALYWKYKKLRPVDQPSPQSPFYLSPVANWKPHHQVWFTNKRIGQVKLSNFWRIAAERGGLTVPGCSL
jgi:hypothetical protein